MTQGASAAGGDDAEVPSNSGRHVRRRLSTPSNYANNNDLSSGGDTEENDGGVSVVVSTPNVEAQPAAPLVTTEQDTANRSAAARLQLSYELDHTRRQRDEARRSLTRMQARPIPQGAWRGIRGNTVVYT